MNEPIKNIRLLLEEITIKCDANWIAFSGGLDSSILAEIKKEQKANLGSIDRLGQPPTHKNDH